MTKKIFGTCFVCKKTLTIKTPYCSYEDFGIRICENCDSIIKTRRRLEAPTKSKKLFLDTSWWIMVNLRDEMRYKNYD